MPKVTVTAKRGFGLTGGRSGGEMIKQQIGAQPVVLRLAEYAFTPGAPFTIQLVPDVSDSQIVIKVDVSYDDGVSYASIGSFTKYTERRYTKMPNESVVPTHVMVTRIAGSSTFSYVVVKD